MDNNIEELFKSGNLLARAMHSPFLLRDEGELYYDFSTWANEYELAQAEGLYSLSTTLILPNEPIPTYDSIGFLIDSEKVDVRHVSETDSLSSGNDKEGDFNAGASSLNSLSDLAKVILEKHDKVMNEVNVNMKEDAYAGLFVNKCFSHSPLALVVLAQKVFEMQSGVVLPIFLYDSKLGSISEINTPENEKNQFLQEMLDRKAILASKVSYETIRTQRKTQDCLLPIEIDSKAI